MPTIIDVLRDDHRLILAGLDLLERAAEREEHGASGADGWWAVLLGWFRTFADRRHHAREEIVLFPAMLRAGLLSQGGLIDVMLDEHESGRALVRAMAAAPVGSRSALAARFTGLLRAHIDKEEEILFPMAESLLDDAALGALRATFEAVATDLGSTGSALYAEGLLDRLGSELGLAPAAA
jgi:hemerythrin-like domain-containing protein